MPARPPAPLGSRFARSGRVLFVALVYLVVSGSVMSSFMQSHGFLWGQERNGFEAMVGFRADRPFCYRILVPLLVDVLEPLVPRDLREARASSFLETSAVLRYERETLLADPDWSLDASVRYHLAYAIDLAALLGVLLVLRWLTTEVFAAPPWVRDFAPPLVLMLLPMTFWLGGYLYDFPELLLVSLGLLLLLRRRWLLFYPVFALAILNKESAVLLAVFFAAVHLDSMPRAHLLAHGAVLAAVGGALMLVVRWAFSDSGGAPAEPNLANNIAFLLSPRNYFRFFSPYAPLLPTPRGYNVLTLGLVAWAAGSRWSETPGWLKRLFLSLLALLVPLNLVAGFEDEIRAYSLLFPALYLLLVAAAFGPRFRDPIERSPLPSTGVSA